MRSRKITLQISLCLVLLLLAMSLVMACPPPALPPPPDSTPLAEPVVEAEPVIEPEPGPVIEPEPGPEPQDLLLTPIPGSRDILERANLELIDQHALATPESAETSIESLAAWLVEPARNELEKARAIYRWVTHNITYDLEAMLTGNIPDQSAAVVLERRTAVCGGYATLFKELSLAAGLQAVKITGWVRGAYGYTIGDSVIGSPGSYHAWNAVKINDGWYLLDSTWGDVDRATVTQEPQRVCRFHEFYFLTPPNQLIYRHFPRNSDWQLLEVPVSAAEFLKPPCVGPPFFEYGLDFDSHTEGVIEVDHQLTVTLQVPADILLSVELRQDDQKLLEWLTFAQRKGEKYQVDAVFPHAGDYILRIFAERKGDDGIFEWMLDYKIRVSEGLPETVGFPETYRDFLGEEVYLYSPKAGYLESGSIQLFKLRVPRAESVVVIVNNKWHHLVKQGELFEGRVTIMTGEIMVAAKFPDREHYHRLLGYTGL